MASKRLKGVCFNSERCPQIHAVEGFTLDPSRILLMVVSAQAVHTWPFLSSA